jgi:hypothetical protein
MHNGDPQATTALCLFHDPGKPPHEVVLTKVNDYRRITYATRVFLKDIEGKWLCVKDRYSGKSNYEPDRWDLAQWLLEAKNI